MLKQKTNKNGSFAALISISVLLLLIILLENISDRIPGLPAVFLPTSQLFTVLKKGAVYSLVAVSMNLLNGFTGLFSLGQAGFMLLGAYTYAILTVPMAAKDQVYYLYGGSAVKFSLPDIFYGIFGSEGAGGMVALTLGVLLAIILGGLVAAIFAYLIGLPVLRLKSDYLAIATLGFAGPGPRHQRRKHDHPDPHFLQLQHQAGKRRHTVSLHRLPHPHHDDLPGDYRHAHQLLLRPGLQGHPGG